ncbi:MAG: sulfotransferase, partial [Phycisphaerales bacterium]|nr:sulfotransferase [Phycisphaerales bacterium]
SDPEVSAMALTEEGVILDRLERYDEAFACFVRARRSAPRNGPTPEYFLELLHGLRAWIGEAGMSTWPRGWSGAPRPAPIFVMGFPRSGTTLIESILSAHPRLTGTDEAPLMAELVNALPVLVGASYPQGLGAIDDRHIPRLHEQYWRSAAAYIRPEVLGDRRLVDKLPLNVPNLPAIRRIFPDARIIYVRRDPRDTLISCMMQRFEAGQAIATFDTLAALARLYVEIEELWQTCRDAIGLAVLEVHYDDLVDDPEPWMRRLVEFTGEAWDDQVLRFHERSAGRTISTPSYAAVSRRIFTTSRGRWRHYRRHLEGVLPQLSPWIRRGTDDGAA